MVDLYLLTRVRQLLLTLQILSSFTHAVCVLRGNHGLVGYEHKLCF